ncbi:MAG: hypothetical protein LBQ00_03570 [Syntrophobacterales bacterium]|jgi:hypothetical protein|nr:hypothetical protein [Syntrophobacterales bacterium]
MSTDVMIIQQLTGKELLVQQIEVEKNKGVIIPIPPIGRGHIGGVPVSDFLTIAPRIERFLLSKKNLRPISVEAIATLRNIQPDFISPVGGMKTPHFHWKDDIYLLEDKDWQEFVGIALKEFRSKLENVSSVNFEKFIELSNAIDTI